MSAPIEALARPEIRGLGAYRSARSIEASSSAMIYLDANESPVEAQPGLGRYPDPQPSLLLDAISALHGVSRSHTLMVRGADEAIDLLMRVFCRPGKDAVLVTPPTYGMYAISARIQGAQVVEVPLVSQRGFELDGVALLDRVRSHQGSLKLVFLCSPNNPTGNAIEPARVEAICAALAGEALVVLDEAYVEFARQESMVARAGEIENLVVLRTLSKAWGAAGARFGMAFASPAIIGLLHKVRPPYPLSTPVIVSALEILTRRGEAKMRSTVQTTRARRRRLAAGLERSQLVEAVFPSEANFLLVRTTELREVLARVRAAGVIVRDRSQLPGLERCVRVSVGDDREIDALLDALLVSTEVRAS